MDREQTSNPSNQTQYRLIPQQERRNLIRRRPNRGSVCTFEGLESRTLMSAAPAHHVPVVHPHHPAVHPHHVAPKPHAPVKAVHAPAKTVHAPMKAVHAPAKKVASAPAKKTAAAPVKVHAATAPGKPANLSASAISATSVRLTWSPGDGQQTGFIILRGTDGAHFSQIAKLTGATATTYTDTTDLSFHTYDYEVESYNGTVTSAATAMAAATTPLLAPATLAAAASGPTTVTLSWALNEPQASGYRILRSTDGTNFTQITQLTGLKIGAYSDTTASSGTAYTYEVNAYNGSNTSATTVAAVVKTPLFTPSGLTAALSGSSVRLAWTGNDSSAGGYAVFRASDGTHYTQIANVVGGNNTAYTDSTALTGHAYSYEVEAYKGTIASAMTAAAAVSIPLVAPTGLAATASTASTVNLAWTDSDINAAGYLVLRGTDGTHFTQIATLTSATAAGYADTTAGSGQTYVYEVEANNGTILSPASGTASATTLLATPATLTATPSGPTSVQLAWANREPLATGFYVLRSSDGINYTQIAKITSATTTSYLDSAASSASAYTYEVQAFSATNHSANSLPAGVTTPLAPPTTLTATLQNGSVQLGWIDNDSNATGYDVLRSINGAAYAQIANVTGASAAGYTDSAVLPGHAYAYEVKAYNSRTTSALTAPTTINTPLAAPSALSVISSSATSVQLGWTDSDVNAAGYYVLRSSDGVNFSQVAKLTTATAATYADSQILTGKSYTYEVEAYAGTITSAASNTAVANTPLATPISLTATIAGVNVNLAWIGKDSAATGYTILRSTDNITFRQLIQVTGASTASYSDASVLAGQTYYYQVKAYNTSATSALSTTATVTTPSGTITNGVTISTRFGDELVITAAGMNDSISLSQNGNTLTIIGDGQTSTAAVPAAGVFVYTRGGNDSISIASSVVAQTTVDSIDGAATALTSNGTHVSAWIDSTDTLVGTAITHSVASFMGGVSKALGASLANPTDAGTTKAANLSLFGTGPVAGDVNQGSIGDCYFLSSLAAFAGVKPQVLSNSAVDLGDGTYAVQFYSNKSPVYVRVSNKFTTGYFTGGFAYAHPGTNNTIWAMVLEKAFCDFRTGANTYASISGGFMDEVYSDFGVNSTYVFPSSISDASLFNTLSNDLANGKAVTFGTSSSAPNLVSDHAYTLVSVSTVNGVNYYTVRNPWGVSGDSVENSQGYATLTYAQLAANFVAGVAAA